MDRDEDNPGRPKGASHAKKKAAYGGLPSNLQGTGDPVGDNPFPMGHPKHVVWKNATLRAEQEVSVLNASYLDEQNRPGGAGGVLSHTRRYLDAWIVTLLVGRFDIWAKRNINVVPFSMHDCVSARDCSSFEHGLETVRSRHARACNQWSSKRSWATQVV